MQRPCWLGEDGRGNGNRVDLEEQPYKWSQRWSDDPPPVLTVNLGNGLVEIYLGRRQLLVQLARLELGLLDYGRRSWWYLSLSSSCHFAS